MGNKEFEKLWIKHTIKHGGLEHPEWGIAKEIARSIYNGNDEIIMEIVNDKIKELQDWIYKNNTMPLKKIGINIGTTDGGWVNAIELNKKIKEIFG